MLREQDKKAGTSWGELVIPDKQRGFTGSDKNGRRI